MQMVAYHPTRKRGRLKDLGSEPIPLPSVENLGWFRSLPAVGKGSARKSSSSKGDLGGWERDLTKEGIHLQPGPCFVDRCSFDGWFRDLTMEGIEPHPGPRRRTRPRVKKTFGLWVLSCTPCRRMWFVSKKLT